MLDFALIAWISLGVFFLLFAVMLASLWRPRQREVMMLRFSEAVGLPSGGDAVVATVRRRVDSLSRARLVGGLLGLVFAAGLLLLNPVWASILTIMLLAFPLIFVGMTLGAVIVTLRESLFPPHPDAPRLARPTAPVLANYVNLRRRMLAPILLGLAALAAIIGTALAATSVIAPSAFFGSAAGPMIAIALAATLLGRLLTARVLDRPQPAASEEELAWDDALRADTLLNLTQLVSFLAWIAVAATVQGILLGVDVVQGTQWGSSLGPQLFTWGVLAITIDSSFGRAKSHFRRQLWPALEAEVAPSADAAS